MKAITVEAFDGVSIDRNIEEQAGPINGRDWKWRKAKHIDDDVAREPAGAFVAELGGEVVGYITTWHDTDSGIGNIPNLAVDRDQRGHGIGRKLIEHALAHFRQLGLRYARIETLAQNPVGQNLYPSLGFREVARQIHYGMPLDD
jgi:ribosomal protein S18 acetylase RimI-like enzyme